MAKCSRYDILKDLTAHGGQYQLRYQGGQNDMGLSVPNLTLPSAYRLGAHYVDFYGGWADIIRPDGTSLRTQFPRTLPLP